MITSWKLFNFKSIYEETTLDFDRLTIFAGANSSGKSTLIQSMLLISQTLSSKISSRSVILNGHLIKLGQFDDLRSYGGQADQVLIGWECKPISQMRTSVSDRDSRSRHTRYGLRKHSLKSVSCEIAFDIKGIGPTSELSQLQPELFSSMLSSRSLAEDRTDLTAQISVLRGDFSNRVPDTTDDTVDTESIALDVILDEASLGEIRDQFPSAHPIGCVLNHFLPDAITIRYDEAEEEARQITSAICEGKIRYLRPRFRYESDTIIPKKALEILRLRLGESGEFIDEIGPYQESLFPEEEYIPLRDFLLAMRKLPLKEIRAIQEKLDEDELFSEIHKAILQTRETGHRMISLRSPRTIFDAAHYLSSLFSHGIRYLGPLRDEPRSMYPLVPNVDPQDVGLQGEYTAAVLNSYKNLRVKYIPSSSFKDPLVAKSVSTRSLQAAVIDWLRYLEVAEGVETFDRGKHGHEMKVTTSGTTTPQDLTHVGVGVSQVLPILVMCLLAETDTTLIIEQPELHLHPLVQTRLADFFLSIALLHKQCIIESHSEYLVNRLRYRIAADTTDALGSLVKVYFAEKDGPRSYFREVAINKFGAISDWPKGFFDQSQSEAEEILRAASQKRKSLRGAKSDDQRND